MKNIAILLCMVVCLFSSCDSFIDINPKAEVVNKDLFDSKIGVEAAVHGLYGSLTSNTMYGKNLSWGWPEILAHHFSAPVDEVEENLAKFDYNRAQFVFSQLWTSAYRSISYSNNIITSLGESTSVFKLKNIYLGEAYGVRAQLHFELIRLFAPNVINNPDRRGIPYVSEYKYVHTDFSTVKQVYDKIVIDLKKAKELLVEDKENVQLPRIPAYRIKENFLNKRELHMNYYAVCAMLARVYWTMGELQLAKEEALEVINSEKFPLVDVDEVLNLIRGCVNDKETIYAIYSTDFYESIQNSLHNTNTMKSYMLYSSDNSDFDGMVDFQDIYARNQPSKENGEDIRSTKWFETTENVPDRKSCVKMFDVLNAIDNSDTPEKRGRTKGFSIIRIPEMYYIVAEAELESGNIDEATKMFDKVIESRGMIPYMERTPSVRIDKDILYNEREKEYFGEGMRWHEMKKENMEVLSNKDHRYLSPSDDIYVFPIPEEEFDHRNL